VLKAKTEYVPQEIIYVVLSIASTKNVKYLAILDLLFGVIAGFRLRQ